MKNGMGNHAMTAKRMMVLVLAATCVHVLAEPVRLKYLESTRKSWANRVAVTLSDKPDESDFVVCSTQTNGVLTSWSITSERLAVPAGSAGYAVSFEIKSDCNWMISGSSGGYETAVRWQDAAGKTLEERPLAVKFHKGSGFERFRFSGTIPAGAAAVEFAVGVDDLHMRPEHRTIVRQSTFAFVPSGQPIPDEVVSDVVAPIVFSRFESPSEDPKLVVRYEITDNQSVDWDSVVVSNLATRALIPFVREGSVITLKPGADWAPGRQALTVSVRDLAGNTTLSRKVFLIGRKPNVPSTSVRDDGAILVGGRPFFPIGIYGIKRCVFNAWDFDRALADLGKAGFNFGQSYFDGRDAELLAAARKHGFMMWTDARFVCKGNDDWFSDVGRKDPSVLAWYIGDDTFQYTKVSELVDRDEAARMLDGTRITCQADTICGGSRKSNYQDFVNYTDVFMPELYHVYNVERKKDEGCVGFVVRDMKRAHDDVAKFGDGRRKHAIWPILQCFHGRTWKRYPDPDEIEAMSFAALVHGANGITWFYYQGEIDPARQRNYSGMYSSRENWGVMTNLSTRISALAPVLLDRTQPQVRPPEVVSGPKTDPIGQPALNVLVKEHAGAAYLIAVNASPEKVRARLFVAAPDGEGFGVWDERKVALANGSFEDDFAGFGVRVYRFSLGQSK